MRPDLTCVISAIAACASPLAAQTETDVTLMTDGQEVIGTLALPDGDPAPVVLLLHGFTGTRDELVIPSTEEGVFERAADALAAAGYASLRIDFRGSGESLADLTFADTTFEGQVADALAAQAWLAADDRVDAERLFLIGWSQGGLVATAAAGRTGAFDAVALWNAVAQPQATYGTILGAETIAAGLAADPGTDIAVTLPWAEFPMKPAFFQGIASFDPLTEIAAYDGPLLVAQGTNDDVVEPASADALIEAHEGPEQLWTAEMDHVFDVFTDTTDFDAMMAATIAWFDAAP